MSIRVLIADDHPVVLAGLRALLAASDLNVEIVAEAKNGREAVDLAAQTRPEICIVDVSMPELDGFEVLQALRENGSASRVIIHSVHNGETVVQRALEYGARGYVLKDGAADDIMAAVRAVHAGNVFLSPALSESMVQQFIGHGAGGTPKVRLTPRETEILKLVGAGLVPKDIAAHLTSAPSTVRVHLNTIRRKLDLHTHAELMRFALREGMAKL